MKALKALTLSLGELTTPVITKYQLGLIVHKIYRSKEYKGEDVALQKDAAESRDFNKYLNDLKSDGVLDNHRDLPQSVFTLLGKSKWAPEDVVCTVDPFAYVSHLSAMSYHGLTDRIPAKLFFSSPGPTDWKNYAQEKMEKDLQSEFDEYEANGLPLLLRTQISKIGKIEIHTFKSKHLGAFKKVRDRELRVSTIGRTFLDMLKSPDLCGGIQHVLETYREFGKQYLRLITDEIDAHGEPIDKVRAGYILDEIVKVDNEVVESWTQFAQRGGSRKLDPTEEYVPKWSDKWCLSLNVFERSK